MNIRLTSVARAAATGTAVMLALAGAGCAHADEMTYRVSSYVMSYCER